VWNLALASDKAVEHVLHGHGRAITDINFHSCEPEIIATCSVDSFVHVWDLRDPKKPVTSFANWNAGASQVKWNRLNPHVLASSHDRNVYIWDDRKGSIPLHEIPAHNAKVNAIDFSRVAETKLFTCSNDGTVKGWNYSKSSQEPRFTIETDFPVWRARHTPFGRGCVIMPLRGGDNSVYLHDVEAKKGVQKMTPVYEFKGHSEPVKEFVWRARGGAGSIDDREFQLVTWSKDHDLRLWPIRDETMENVGFRRGEPLTMKITRKGAKYETYQKEPNDSAYLPSRRGVGSYGVSPSSYRRDGRLRKPANAFMTRATTRPYYNQTSNSHLDWISGVRIGRSAFAAPFDASMGADFIPSDDMTPANLGEEVGIVGHKFPKVHFEKISVSTGECIISLAGPWGDSENELVYLRVEVRFPLDYPFGAPTFKIEEDSKFADGRQQELTTELRRIAQQLSVRGRYCLEPCLRYLLGDKIAIEDYNADLHPKEPLIEPTAEEVPDLGNDFTYSLSSSDDDDDDDIQDTETQVQFLNITKLPFDSTPVPKGCGAVWSKNGELVCFFIAKTEKPKGLLLLRAPEKGFVASPALGLKDDNGNSDSSDSFESDSEDLLEEGRFYRALSTVRFRTNLRFQQFNDRVTGSARSNSGSQGVYSSDSRIRNVVRIYDFKHLIPSRRDMAAEYKILGAPPEELARWNAEVASNHGFEDISYCWRLIEQILSLSMPVVEPMTSKMAVPASLTAISNKLLAIRFDWAGHPFGRRWLVDELFKFFAKQNNTQMLAFMSCIMSGRLSENRPESRSQSSHMSEAATYILSPFSHDLLSRENSGGYFGGSLFPMYNKTTPIEFGSSGAAGSPVSSRDNSSLMSTSPDKVTKKPGFLAIQSTPRPVPHARDISSSSSRALSNSAYATANNSVKSAHTPLRRLDSDNDLNLGLMFNYSGHNTRLGSRNSVYDIETNPLSLVPVPKIRVDILNDEILDFAELVDRPNPASNLLLDPQKNEAYARYREEYAAMLYSWGLQVERLEILKFNYVPAAPDPGPRRPSVFDKYHYSHIQFRLARQLDDPEIVNANEMMLNRSYSRTCHYCKLMVRTRFFQCLNCEHILHASCGVEWFVHNEGKECVSGCGCSCLNYL
jgi:WD40 repeat protein